MMPKRVLIAILSLAMLIAILGSGCSTSTEVYPILQGGQMDSLIQEDPKGVLEGLQGRVMQKQSPYNKVRTLYYMGKAFLVLNDAENATECFNQALFLCDQEKDNRPEWMQVKGLTHLELGMVYWKHDMSEEALEQQQQAEAIMSQLADSANWLLAVRNTGWILASLGRYEEAEDAYNQSLVMSQTMHRPEITHALYLEIGRDCYMNSGETQKAIEYIQYALNLRRDDTDWECNNDISIAHTLLGILYYYEDDGDAAMAHLIEAVKSDKASLRMSAYQTLSAIETERGDYQKALEYHNRFVDNMIETDNEMRNESIQRVRNDYQLKIQEKNMLMQQRMTRFRLAIVILALFSVSLLVILILNKKNTRNKLEAQRLRYEAERNQSRIRELVGQMEDLVQQNAELKSESEAVPQRENEIIGDWGKTNRILLLTDKLKDNITAETLQFRLDEDDWKGFISLTDWMYDGFTNRLRERYPKLTSWDLRICCLVKHHVPNYVISLLLDMQTASYYRRKTRIKQNKMNVTDDNRSFEEIINEQ